MFTILDGEIEFIFRGEARRAGAGSTVNIPANAASLVQEQVGQAGTPALHVHCQRGRRNFFVAVGDPVDSRVVATAETQWRPSGPSACNGPRRSPPNIERNCCCNAA